MLAINPKQRAYSVLTCVWRSEQSEINYYEYNAIEVNFLVNVASANVETSCWKKVGKKVRKSLHIYLFRRYIPEYIFSWVFVYHNCFQVIVCNRIQGSWTSEKNALAIILDVIWPSLFLEALSYFYFLPVLKQCYESSLLTS